MNIEDEIHGLSRQPQFSRLKVTPPDKHSITLNENSGDFLEVNGPSSHMRVHKTWRWILAAIFILGKIFLGFAIFYYLESKQAHEQIQELKMELKQIRKG